MNLLFRSNQTASSPANRRKIGDAVAKKLAANPNIVAAPVEGAQIYYYSDFLTPEQCDRLIAIIDANRRPSTLLSRNADAEFRTSESCDMDRYAPDIQPIDESIADLLGLPYKNGETMQGQRYAVGQQFRAHHDWFHATEHYWQQMLKEGGQRTWTAMIFLNDVDDGGATWFPQAGARFKPKRGLLLAWNNMQTDGKPNEMTLHEGMPVLKGTKYIVTKWFRENAWIQ